MCGNIHVRERQAGLLKTDKRDALGRANHLYLQLGLGAQLPDKRLLVRRAVPPTEAAARLRGLIRHRYELTQDTVRHKNKLTAICDELFPEFTRVLRDPNLPGALLVRERFPTPHAVATAPLADLCACRSGTRPSNAQFQALQEAARTSIGTGDLGRQRGLCLEQKQLIQTLRMLREQLCELDAEITQLTQASREGQILLSIPGIGSIQAATIIAAVGHLDNFPTAAALRAYFGWAPQVRQSGTTLDQTRLSRSGMRTMKQAMFLIVGNAIQMECEWARIYQRLVEKKCVYNERKQAYVGKVAVMGRIAGQMTSLIYMLLKRDADLLRHWRPGVPLPKPTLYDPAIHHAHCHGHYRSAKAQIRRGQHGTLTLLPQP
jgi:transposase